MGLNNNVRVLSCKGSHVLPEPLTCPPKTGELSDVGSGCLNIIVPIASVHIIVTQAKATIFTRLGIYLNPRKRVACDEVYVQIPTNLFRKLHGSSKTIFLALIPI